MTTEPFSCENTTKLSAEFKVSPIPDFPAKVLNNNTEATTSTQRQKHAPTDRPTDQPKTAQAVPSCLVSLVSAYEQKNELIRWTQPTPTTKTWETGTDSYRQSTIGTEATARIQGRKFRNTHTKTRHHRHHLLRHLVPQHQHSAWMVVWEHQGQEW